MPIFYIYEEYLEEHKFIPSFIEFPISPPLCDNYVLNDQDKREILQPITHSSSVKWHSSEISHLGFMEDIK